MEITRLGRILIVGFAVIGGFLFLQIGDTLIAIKILACVVLGIGIPTLFSLSPAKSAEHPQPKGCSFCKKSVKDVGPLIEGPDEIYVCGECIELCRSILDQEYQRRSELVEVESPD